VADDQSRAGTRYASPDITAYLNGVHAPHDQALAQAFEADRRENLPAIQLAPSEARAVELLLRLAGARKAVEIGTLAGYSAIRIARGLAPDGHLWTIELEAPRAAVARQNLSVAGLSDRVTVVEGSGLDVLPTLERHGPFDAVFVDADKKSYDRYGRWAAANVRPGGLLLGDNAYLFGRLLEDSEEAGAMRRFHEEARASFDTVCLPTPDGLLLGIRR
jgi:caffeoyl-CoA O-methyltransferase